MTSSIPNIVLRVSNNFKFRKVLISPKRLYENEITEEEKITIKGIWNTKSNYYMGDHIIIKKEEESFTVLEGLDEVKSAIIGQVPYVLVKLNEE